MAANQKAESFWFHLPHLAMLALPTTPPQRWGIHNTLWITINSLVKPVFSKYWIQSDSLVQYFMSVYIVIDHCINMSLYIYTKYTLFIGHCHKSWSSSPWLSTKSSTSNGLPGVPRLRSKSSNHPLLATTPCLWAGSSEGPRRPQGPLETMLGGWKQLQRSHESIGFLRIELQRFVGCAVFLLRRF